MERKKSQKLCVGKMKLSNLTHRHTMQQEGTTTIVVVFVVMILCGSWSSSSFLGS